MLTLAVLALAGCGDRDAAETTESPQLPDQEIDGFTLIQTRDGEKQWSLAADHALIYDETDRVEAEELRIEFFNAEGLVVSVLTATRGILMRKTNDMEALGNVVVTRDDGTTLRSERLSWNDVKRKIETREFVEVTKGDDVMTGVGLECDADLENIRVKSEFKAYVRTPADELVEEE